MSLAEDERRALDAVDVDEAVRLTRELVRVPSVTGSAGELDVQELVASVWRSDGVDVDLWSESPDELAALPGFPGVETERDVVRCLAGRVRGSGGGRSLLLNGHVDVVPPGDLAQWSGDPFDGRVADGAVWGRGACDMKAGVACATAALRAVRRAGVVLRGDVVLHSVVGEEDGGVGTFATLRRGFVADAAIVPEPTDGTLIVANAGALTFRLVVRGRSAHAATRDEGVSALSRFVPVLAALEELEVKRNASPDPLFGGRTLPYALSIGTVRAGEWPSSVPDRLVAEGRLGVALDEPVSEARRALESTVAAVCAADPWLSEHPVEVSWSGGQYASGRLPDGHALLALVRNAVVDAGGDEPAVTAAPYGSDLRLLAAAGVPTLHLGPGDVRLAHAPDERVPVAEIETVTRALVLAMLRWCG